MFSKRKLAPEPVPDWRRLKQPVCNEHAHVFTCKYCLLILYENPNDRWHGFDSSACSEACLQRAARGLPSESFISKKHLAPPRCNNLDSGSAWAIPPTSSRLLDGLRFDAVMTSWDFDVQDIQRDLQAV